MQLSIVTSTAPEEAHVFDVGDVDRLPADRRLRIAFGSVSIYLTTADALALADELQRVRNRVLADAIRHGVEDPEFIPL